MAQATGRKGVKVPVKRVPPKDQQSNGQLVGYARTSTVDQEAGLEAQERDLRAAGCVRLFSERVSSVAKRDELAAALDYVRAGDTVVVTRPDRLARSVADLLDIIGRLEAKGVGLLVLSMGGQPVDTRTPTGRLTLTMLGAVAEFERALMLERQREGIAKAKAEGRYNGRKPTAREKSSKVFALSHDGYTASEIARQLGIGRSSVYRILNSAGPAAP
ncbi:recombinase family protein [Falsiroseomonas sp.]|uniref:recombinase family protein n=1 Tax=Falsiroseomonas sp. TaxID=2870721 RepID=UPI0035626995